MVLITDREVGLGADLAGNRSWWLSEPIGERGSCGLRPATRLEWQDDVHDLLAIAWLLDIGELAAATICNARFGNFFRFNGVVRRDVFWPNDTGDENFTNLEIDTDLLTALDHEIAVWQNLKNNSRDGCCNGFRPINGSRSFG